MLEALDVDRGIRRNSDRQREIGLGFLDEEFRVGNVVLACATRWRERSNSGRVARP
jgi:hypothetical protein